MEELKALKVTQYTLLGSNNCFSVQAEDGKHYRIVNYYLEDLEAAVKAGVEWPFTISIIGEGAAVMADERLDDDTYQQRFCSVCCPRELLPLPQRLKHSLDIKRGKIKETTMVVDGKEMTITTYFIGK